MLRLYRDSLESYGVEPNSDHEQAKKERERT